MRAQIREENGAVVLFIEGVGEMRLKSHYEAHKVLAALCEQVTVKE